MTAPEIEAGSKLHEALAFVAMHDPDPVTYETVRQGAGFDTKTLDRLRTKRGVRTVDRTEIEVPAVTRSKSPGESYEYRMTDVGWEALEATEQGVLDDP